MRKPIVITGGPCGGKTTICRWLARALVTQGVSVTCLPEAARMAISILGPARASAEKLELQALIARFQMAMEDAAVASARRGGVIIEDRGILDAKAYLSAPAWSALRRRLALTEANVLARYAAVIHLTSCAVDKPACYQGDDLRHEGLLAAQKLDRDIWRSWNAHPVQIRIDNLGQGLRQKRERVLQEILRLAKQSRF